MISEISDKEKIQSSLCTHFLFSLICKVTVKCYKLIFFTTTGVSQAFY